MILCPTQGSKMLHSTLSRKLKTCHSSHTFCLGPEDTISSQQYCSGWQNNTYWWAHHWLQQHHHLLPNPECTSNLIGCPRSQLHPET